jgi:MFS family permease
VRRLRKDITQLLKASTTTLINAMGATIFVYSLSLKLLETTGSALGYGVNIFIGPIVGLICSPLIGKVIDKYSKKNIAILSECSLVIILILFAVAFPYIQKNLFIYSIIFVCLDNICARFFTISYLSSAPDIVSKDQLQRLNAIQTTGVAVANMLALPIAGFIYGILPFEYIIIIEIFAEVLTILLTIITEFKAEKKLVKAKAHNNVGGLKILFKYKKVLELVIIAMILNFSITSIEIGIPYTIIHVLKKTSVVSGNIQSLFSMGVIVGGILISAIKLKNVLAFTQRIYTLFTWLLLAFGISLYVFTKYTLIIFIIFELLLGILTAIADPPLFTYIQEEIPKDYLGRINTFIYTIVQLLTPIGVAVYSTCFSFTNYANVYLISGVIIVISISIIKYILGKRLINDSSSI